MNLNYLFTNLPLARLIKRCILNKYYFTSHTANFYAQLLLQFYIKHRFCFFFYLMVIVFLLCFFQLRVHPDRPLHFYQMNVIPFLRKLYLNGFTLTDQNLSLKYYQSLEQKRSRSFQRGAMSLCSSKGGKLQAIKLLRMILLSMSRTWAACVLFNSDGVADFFFFKPPTLTAYNFAAHLPTETCSISVKS